ncbi:tryptophan-rich sensory protein [Candidatus Peregrinibacteria bacterium]|nr:tryptophan-rich sensory protein [Candidatus Peregrinibacteria bacterium]
MFDFIKKLLSREKTSKKEKIISFIIFFVYVAGLGYVSSTSAAPDAWYASLIKPEAMPPNYLFGIVWPILYIFLAVSAYYVWNHYKTTKFKRNLYVLFYAINGILMYAWTKLFFGMHNMTGALYVIIGIIVVAEIMIILAFSNKKRAAYYLFPFLLWILYATYLNATILSLNPA